MTPITTTLQAIRKAHPCKLGWDKVKAAYPNLGMTEELSLSNILLSNDLEDAYWVATQVLGYQVPLANHLIPLIEDEPYWSKLFESWGDEHPGDDAWQKEWDTFTDGLYFLPHEQEHLIGSILALYDPDEIESEPFIHDRKEQTIQFLAWVG